MPNNNIFSNIKSPGSTNQEITIIRLPSIQEVYKQGVSSEKLWSHLYFLVDFHEKNLITKQSKEPIASQKPKKKFQKIINFCLSKKPIETETTNEQKLPISFNTIG